MLTTLLTRLSDDELGHALRIARHIVVEMEDEVARRRQAAASPVQQPDRLLSPSEAATMFSVGRRWLLDHANDIPGVKRLSKKVIRFSEKGLTKYLNGRKP